MCFSQYPGWTLTSDGSLFMATVNDDAAGTYRCTPYNSYGTMGSSGPTSVILQVSVQSRSPGSPESYCVLHEATVMINVRQITFHTPQIPVLLFRCDPKSATESVLLVPPSCLLQYCELFFLISHNCICHSELKAFRETTFYWPFYSDVSPLTLIEVNSE